MRGRRLAGILVTEGDEIGKIPQVGSGPMPACQTPDPHDAPDHDAFRTYRRTRDRAVRDRLVQDHLGLAHAMAERYVDRGIARDDLRQVAALGLVKAVERFDPDRGVAFSSFAVPTILGELRRHFRDAGWMISVPRRLQELRQQVDRTVALFQQRHGRTPSLDEVAAHLHEDPEDVLLALEGLRSCYRPSSLDQAPVDAPDDAEVAHVDDAVLVQGLVDGLPPRQREIVVLRYWGDLTQQEIADQVGISQMHVSRLLRRSLSQMSAATR